VTSKVDYMIRFYQIAFDRYGGPIEDAVFDYWQNEFGDNLDEEFFEIDRKLKVKFYYED
jgi:hypothetical protein